MARAGGTLRPVDLARAAGVSTQQVRNYEEAGVLPPVPRTPSGYRRFDAGHRAAMLAYRALARGYGPDGAQEIMRAVHAGDVARALARVDAGHAVLHEQRRSLGAAGEALELVAADRAALPRADLRIGEVAARLGVRTSALRVWESAGLLAPGREPVTGYRRYAPADVRDARMVQLLRQVRYPLPQIGPVLDGLRRTGGSGALREALERRRAELTFRAAAMLEGSSDLHRYLVEFRADLVVPPG
ncbi:MerR family transcriptional regulator [Actinomadura roseirufa]|uniref:MerR family transcriptional regulator n=1 Tax=Actinomadura roseirufa TaxID=2094049 RepID=UPI0010414EB7|nr:MerR family transcriptional regulator [Actinomadura roseirufa]